MKGYTIKFQLENSATYLLGPDIVVPGKETYLLSNDAYSYYFDRANHSISWELFDKSIQMAENGILLLPK